MPQVITNCVVNVYRNHLLYVFQNRFGRYRIHNMTVQWKTMVDIGKQVIVMFCVDKTSDVFADGKPSV